MSSVDRESETSRDEEQATIDQAAAQAAALEFATKAEVAAVFSDCDGDN